MDEWGAAYTSCGATRFLLGSRSGSSQLFRPCLLPLLFKLISERVCFHQLGELWKRTACYFSDPVPKSMLGACRTVKINEFGDSGTFNGTNEHNVRKLDQIFFFLRLSFDQYGPVSKMSMTRNQIRYADFGKVQPMQVTLNWIEFYWL